jgi:hypothetical protein
LKGFFEVLVLPRYTTRVEKRRNLRWQDSTPFLFMPGKKEMS